MKGGLGQPAGRKQLMGGHTMTDNSRGLLQWVRSISFAAIAIDHSLHLAVQADSPSPSKLPTFMYLTRAMFSKNGLYLLFVFAC